MKIPARNLSQRIALYGLGAGAVTIAAAAAKHHKQPTAGFGRGTIIYSGPVEFSNDTIYFDLQNVTPPSDTSMTNDDFELKSSTCTKSKAKIEGVGSYNGQIAGSTSGTRVYAFEFQAGQTIGTQHFYSSAYLQDYEPGNGNGFWHVGDRGFLGLKITIDCNDFYGWADVTLNNLDCDGAPVFTLHDYAIHTEVNESVEAGEKKELKKHIHLYPTSCTPTPSPTPTPTPTPTPSPVTHSAAMGLLIFGAAGVTSLKKRRKQSSLV